MMIVTLTAQRASFFHAEKAYPASSETVKLRTPTARKRMQTAVTIATAAACCSPSTQ
jgi:hypothetical protein